MLFGSGGVSDALGDGAELEYGLRVPQFRTLYRAFPGTPVVFVDVSERHRAPEFGDNVTRGSVGDENLPHSGKLDDALVSRLRGPYALDEKVHLLSARRDERGLHSRVVSARVFHVESENGEFATLQVLEIERRSLVRVPEFRLVFGGQNGVEVIPTEVAIFGTRVIFHGAEHDFERGWRLDGDGIAGVGLVAFPCHFWYPVSVMRVFLPR